MPVMAEHEAPPSLHERLTDRIGPTHLRQRLGIEGEGEARVFGRGRTFFHPENWYSMHALLQLVLRASFMYRRGQRNALNIQLRRNTVRIDNLPQALHGLRLLHITDLHLDMHPDFPHALSNRVRDLDYDACVLTGDYRYRTHGPVDEALRGLELLRPHLRGPVYGILGNHDSIHMVPRIEDLDIRLLLNENIALEYHGARLYLAGIDDPHYFRTDNLERACAGIPHDAPSVLLAHSPEIYRQAAHAGFALMLCGHTHGGQIRLPGAIPLYCNASCPRRLCSGAWRHHTMQGYTSLGAGSSIVAARFNCLPEVVIHELQRA